MSGLYVVFEGGDGVGKTTTIDSVCVALQKRYPKLPIISTRQPGSTPLGKHLRKLIKTPSLIDPEIEIDDLSRQMLFMVDTVNFINCVLQPSLAANKLVLVDRSTFISAIVYGLADDLPLDDITKLFDIITPPKMDKLYILTCPLEVSQRRLEIERDSIDHYDVKPKQFATKVSDIYNNLITRSSDITVLVSRSVVLENIIYVDTNVSSDHVVNTIVNDLSKLIVESGII